MNTLVLAIVLSMPFAATAHAQSANSTGQNAGTTTAPSADVTSQQKGEYHDFSAFLETFGNADFTAANTALEGTSTYTVVSIASLANADKASLQTEIDKHAQDIEALRALISDNQEAVGYLEDEGLTPEHVVWAESADNGTILLFVSDFDGV
jgi:hypothetical protein